jgi:hypothetical protein
MSPLFFFGLVADLCAEGLELRVAKAVAADEVHHQEHQQRAADHHHNSDLEPEDQIREIVEAPDDVGPRMPPKSCVANMYTPTEEACARRGIMS